MRKKLISSMILTAGLSFSTLTVPHNAAAASVSTSSTQMVKGQIGKVTILQDTTLVKPGSNQQMTVVRTLKKGRTYRVYSVNHFSGVTYYGVGAGYYVKASSQVKYAAGAAKITTEFPTVNTLTDKNLTISGRTEPGATVFISRNSVHLASFKADQTGYYFMPIPLQMAGTVFSVYAKDSANNTSHVTEVTVSAQARKASEIFNAPIVKQMPELPRGCEVTSLTMLLNYMGIDVGKMTLAQQLKKDPTPYKVVGGKTYFGNPNVGFVGSMYDSNLPGYGVYNQPIEALARNYSSRIVNLTGQSFNKVLDYVSLRHPVWVITSYGYIPSQEWETYYTPEGPVQVTSYEHSVLITGYDANYVYFNDPLSGTTKKKPINDVKTGWEQLGSQAISYY